MEKIYELLSEAHKIIEKYDTINLNTNKGFNVFSAIIKNDEVKNSAFIAELLNPQGTHGQGSVFLKLFVDLINENISLKSNLNPLKSSVFVEKSIDKEAIENENENEKGGFIDIFITDYKNCIVIENKIDAGDQQRQLIRYYNHCKNRNYETTILYLTPNGRPATKESTDEKLIEGKDYHCISYHNHIFEWLRTCKENCNDEHLKNIIYNYLNYIVTNFKQYRIMKEITPTLEKNLEAAKEISKNFDSALISVSTALRKAVKELVETKLKEKYPQVKISLSKKFKNLRDDYFSSIYIDNIDGNLIVESFNTKGIFYGGGLFIGKFSESENPPYSNHRIIIKNKDELLKKLDLYGKGENREKLVSDIVEKIIQEIPNLCHDLA